MRNVQQAEDRIARVKLLQAENFGLQSEIMRAVQRMNQNSLELAKIAEMELYGVVVQAQRAENGKGVA